MSSGERRPWAEAAAIAADFLEYVKDVAVYSCIAGSIRRKKPTVGDVEMVIEPSSKAALWNRLDVMVNMGTLKKAVYHDKNEKNTFRWGDTFRAVVFMKMEIEIYTCDSDNRGFQTWLRTGSAEKNKYVARMMMQKKHAVRFSDGYAWHVSYDAKHPMFDTDLGYVKLNKLRVPDEAAVYDLLGMPVMGLNQREEQFYAAHLDKGMKAPHELDLKLMYAGGQRSMF